MNSPHSWIDALSDAIRSTPNEETSAFLTPETAAHLRIYTNNLFTALSDVLREHYPATAALLGPRNFNLFAWRYTQAHPPHCEDIGLYGDGFAAFLEHQPEIQNHQPSLPFFALLDWAMLHPLSPDEIELHLPAHIFEHHTSVRESGVLAPLPLGELIAFRFVTERKKHTKKESAPDRYNAE